MKSVIFVMLMLISTIGMTQPYTRGGYNQLYWDWRPDISSNCYEFTFINTLPVGYIFGGPLIDPYANLYYWNDCNYGKNWINSNDTFNTFSNYPLHDTLFRITSHWGIRDTFCGYDVPYQAGNNLNYAETTSPHRAKVIFKGLIYLPEKCNQWHFTVGNSDSMTDDRAQSGYFTFKSGSAIPVGPLFNIDSSVLLTYWNAIYPADAIAYGTSGASFNNVDFPNNSSPRLLSNPIYSFPIQKQVEFNPGLYDPDHDSLGISIADTIYETDYLYSYGSSEDWFFQKNNAYGVPFEKVFTQNHFFAPLPGQTGPNPIRYNALNNPFDTDSTFHLVDSTGKMTFTAQSVMEPILNYRVREYRNGILLSETYCINQFTIRPDGRSPSYLRIDTNSIQNAYFNNQGTLLSAPGLPISFDAWVKLPGGPSGNLIVSTTADTTLPGNGTCSIAGLNTDSVHLHFSWTPPANAKGLYNVFVNAKDSNCSPPYNHYLQVYTWSFYIDSSLSPVSVSNIYDTHHFTIYPNPANDILHISGSKPFQSLKLFSLDGRELLTRQFNAVSEIDLPTAQFAPGMYLLLVDGLYQRKVVVGR